MLRIAEAARHLIHDPAAYAGVFDFRPLRPARRLYVIESQREQLPQTSQHRDLERCGARV